MHTHHIAYLYIAYLFAIAAGIVSSGAIGSLWAILAGESPRFSMLADDDIFIPIKVPVVILSGPTTLLMDGAWWLVLELFARCCYSHTRIRSNMRILHDYLCFRRNFARTCFR